MPPDVSEVDVGDAETEDKAVTPEHPANEAAQSRKWRSSCFA